MGHTVEDLDHLNAIHIAGTKGKVCMVAIEIRIFNAFQDSI